MTLERKSGKPEIAAQKRTIKLTPAIGDWTTYKPPKVLVKRVKSGLYGFDRLSKEELNQVLFIHYRFIQALLKRFKIDLGMAVELFTVQVEQTTYLNFLRSLMGQVVQCRISVAGLHDPIYLFLELPLANSLINYSLGSINLEPINRALTEAEKTTLAATLSEYLPLLAAAFAQTITDLSLTIVGSPDVVMDSTINPNSTLASFIAETSLADQPPGKIIIAYAGSTLKNLLAKYQLQELAKIPDFSRLPANLLSKISAPVRAILGETSLTTNDLRQFEVGDVVSLESTISSPIPVTIGNILKLLGQAGIKNKKSAARVVGLREATEIELPPPELAAEKEAKAEAKTPAPPVPKPAAAAAVVPAKPAEDLGEDISDEDLLDEDDELFADFPEDKFPEDEL